MDEFKKNKCRCCSKRCCIITWIILIPLLIALALILFFLIPRIPEHEEKFLGMNNYVLQPNYFMVNVSYSIRINNKNYVPIKIGKSHMELWHKNETYVGETNPDNINFPARKDTTRTELFIVTTEDGAVIQGIVTEVPRKTFVIRGFIRVVYLGIGIKFNLNEPVEFDMTSSLRRSLVLDMDSQTVLWA